MTQPSTYSPEHSFRVPLSKAGLIIFGFGYYRIKRNDPWFKVRDLYDAIPDSPAKRYITPSKSHLSKFFRTAIEVGLMEGRADERRIHGPPTNQAFTRLTDSGEALLIESTTYVVTHSGLSLPEIFHIPEVTQTILNESDLMGRVYRQIAGLGNIALTPNT